MFGRERSSRRPRRQRGRVAKRSSGPGRSRCAPDVWPLAPRRHLGRARSDSFARVRDLRRRRSEPTRSRRRRPRRRKRFARVDHDRAGRDDRRIRSLQAGQSTRLGHAYADRRRRSATMAMPMHSASHPNQVLESPLRPAVRHPHPEEFSGAAPPPDTLEPPLPDDPSELPAAPLLDVEPPVPPPAPDALVAAAPPDPEPPPLDDVLVAESPPSRSPDGAPIELDPDDDDPLVDPADVSTRR